MGAATERLPEVVLEDGLRKRKGDHKAGSSIIPSSRVTPLSQVWVPSQRIQNITIWILLSVTIFFSIAVVVEELQASWYRSPALNALNSHLYGAESLDRVLQIVDEQDGSRTIELAWNVTKEVKSPDGIRSNAYLINGHFPGPELVARPGDVLSLSITNSLEDEPVSLNFLQEPTSGLQSIWGGAKPKVSIAAHEQRQIEVRIPQDTSGTFMYRAEDQTQASGGLFGALVVQRHDPPLGSDIIGNITSGIEEERMIVISDWHPFSADRISSRVLPTVASSTLVNGIGNRNCSEVDSSLKIDCVQKTGRSQPSMHFVAGRQYRLRIINAGTSSSIAVSLSGAFMTIIELDGGLRVQPKRATSIGMLRPSQTVDVVIAWESGGDEELMVTLDDEIGDVPRSTRFPVRVSGFINGRAERPVHRHRDILRLKPLV